MPESTQLQAEKKPAGTVKPEAAKAASATGKTSQDVPAEAAKAKGKNDAEKAAAKPAKDNAGKAASDTETQGQEPPAKEEKAAAPVKGAAAAKPRGLAVTQVFADRLEYPDENALKSLPVPKEGEGFSMRLHPAYFYQFLDHPFSINREVADYKDLYDSIALNGINEPVKARTRKDGGLELISGHRRHDIAKQLNYPVPVVIVQEDDDTAQIEVVDGNLHRQDIPTSELARAAKMKMSALARKTGRRSKMDKLTGPQKRTDQIVAEDMGISRNQVNRLVRIDSLVPALKQKVDDKKLPFNTAVELSYLSPEEQGQVVSFMEKQQMVPSQAQAVELKKASRAAAEQVPEASAKGEKAPQTSEKKPAPVNEKTISSIVKPKTDPEIKYTFTSTELKEYFPDNGAPTVSEVKRKVFDALDLQKRVAERAKAKQAVKDAAKSR